MFSRMEYQLRDRNHYTFCEVFSEDVFADPLHTKDLMDVGSKVGLIFICFEDEPDEATLIAHGRAENVQNLYYEIIDCMGPESEDAQGLRHVAFSPDVDQLNRLVAGVHTNGNGAMCNPYLGGWFTGLNKAVREQLQSEPVE